MSAQYKRMGTNKVEHASIEVWTGEVNSAEDSLALESRALLDGPGPKSSVALSACNVGSCAVNGCPWYCLHRWPRLDTDADFTRLCTAHPCTLKPFRILQHFLMQC